MKLFKEIPGKGQFKNPAVTIGNFDGVHMGHQEILSTLLKKAEEINGDAVVITFQSHPRKIINPQLLSGIITTSAEKVKAISTYGINNIILLDFDRDMADMDALEFYNKIIVNGIGAKEIVIGYDHCFGKDRKGNMEFLERMSGTTGIGITRVEEVEVDSKSVSSTWLRKVIGDGNMKAAKKIIARPYSIMGKVIKGESRGRELGFPTANILPNDAEKIIPGDGVYAVTVILENGNKARGMLNIGDNPTFDLNKKNIEVNIFDFNDDIYGSLITIEFHERVRDEIKFESSRGLVQQLKKDKISIQKMLDNL
ncbi:bifunctional riboflavin kinase/FAD synthetase [Spirochaetota bacterium]